MAREREGEAAVTPKRKPWLRGAKRAAMGILESPPESDSELVDRLVQMCSDAIRASGGKGKAIGLPKALLAMADGFADVAKLLRKRARYMQKARRA